MLEKFNEIKEKYDKLMTGRYGVFDTLNKDMIIVCLVIGFLNLFIRSLIIRVLSPALIVLVVLRLFSTNEVKRITENRKYMEFKEKSKEFLKIQYQRVKEYKTHRYYKCKNCSSYIRVPAKKGKHTIDCPKCGKEFGVKIL